jgi:hypothetical protein
LDERNDEQSEKAEGRFQGTGSNGVHRISLRSRRFPAKGGATAAIWIGDYPAMTKLPAYTSRQGGVPSLQSFAKAMPRLTDTFFTTARTELRPVP